MHRLRIFFRLPLSIRILPVNTRLRHSTNSIYFEIFIYIHKNLFAQQAPDLLEKLAESLLYKVSKGAKIRNRYNQVPHLTQDTNGKVTNSQLDTTNDSQAVNPFPAGDHKAYINRRTQRHSKHKTEQKHKRSTKEVPPWNGQ